MCEHSFIPTVQEILLLLALAINASEIRSKTFGQDMLPHATPRKALGDVKNVTLQHSASTIKNPLKSQRKLTTSTFKSNHSNAPVSSMSLTSKTITKKIKEKDDYKNNEHMFPMKQLQETDKDGLFLQQEKEIMFPYQEEDPEFIMPEYLKTILHGEMIESLWWPKFTEPSKTEVLKFPLVSQKAQIEELPLREDMEDPFWTILPDHLTDPLLASSQPDEFDLSADGCLSLGELEKDLDEIDRNSSL